MIKEADCVELGLTCAKVCQSLDPIIRGRGPEELSRPVLKAIEGLNG